VRRGGHRCAACPGGAGPGYACGGHACRVGARAPAAALHVCAHGRRRRRVRGCHACAVEVQGALFCLSQVKPCYALCHKRATISTWQVLLSIASLHAGPIRSTACSADGRFSCLYHRAFMWNDSCNLRPALCSGGSAAERAGAHARASLVGQLAQVGRRVFQTILHPGQHGA